MKTWTLVTIILCMLFFISGMYMGSVLTTQHLFKGAVMIAEGLEGTEFNIDIDFNETIMVDRLYENMEEYGLFDMINETKNCSKDFTGRTC
jgi:hypothetical protein